MQDLIINDNQKPTSFKEVLMKTVKNQKQKSNLLKSLYFENTFNLRLITFYQKIIKLVFQHWQN